MFLMFQREIFSDKKFRIHSNSKNIVERYVKKLLSRKFIIQAIQDILDEIKNLFFIEHFLLKQIVSDMYRIDIWAL